MNVGGGDTRTTRRIRVTKIKVTKDRRYEEVLPLDPRDPDIVRAKRGTEVKT
jgi:hypothetical protein